MKASVTSVLLAALAGTSAAQGITVYNADTLRAESAPHAVSMSTLRQRKTEQREKDIAAGLFDEDRYEATGATACEDGKAGEYLCNNVDLVGFLRHQDAGSRTRQGNDIWGMPSTGVSLHRKIPLLTIPRLDGLCHWSRVCPCGPERRDCLCRGSEGRKSLVRWPLADTDRGFHLARHQGTHTHSRSFSHTTSASLH